MGSIDHEMVKFDQRVRAIANGTLENDQFMMENMRNLLQLRKKYASMYNDTVVGEAQRAAASDLFQACEEKIKALLGL